jgi:hypothetical protein
MIERFPDGTDAIPYPHKIFNWKTGGPTLQVEIAPSERGNPPKIEGWKPFFVGFLGYDAPHMTYSYKQEVPA